MGSNPAYRANIYELGCGFRYGVYGVSLPTAPIFTDQVMGSGTKFMEFSYILS